MANTLKTVRFMRAWQQYRVGAEITPNARLRDWLIANGYAEIVEAGSPQRPAKLSAKAARKLADAGKPLF